jgi:hypothetical protein
VIICIEAGKEICAAAKELNIRIYDYQHGQINEYNPSYNHRLFNMKNIHLPTGYLCWDRNTKNYLIFIIKINFFFFKNIEEYLDQ